MKNLRASLIFIGLLKFAPALAAGALPNPQLGPTTTIGGLPPLLGASGGLAGGLVKTTGSSTNATTTAVAGTDYLLPTGSGAGLTSITAAQVGALPIGGGTLTGNLTMSLSSGGEYINSAPAGNQVSLTFQDGGTGKWAWVKTAGNVFDGYDAANAQNFLTVNIAGLLTLGESAQISIPASGAPSFPSGLSGTQVALFGAGQSALTLNTTGALGGSLALQDSGTGLNNGGAIIFGFGQGYFAGIKARAQNGNNNTAGNLSFYTRRLVTDSTLTEAAYFDTGGNLNMINGGGLNGPTLTALPSATTSQLYGGTAAAGTAAAVTVGSGLALSSGTLTATGAAGTAAPGFRNRLINGDFRVDQRNSYNSQTITAGAALAYTADRWYGYSTGANVTGVDQSYNLGSPSFQGQGRYQFTGASGVTGIGFGQRIEAANSFDLAGTTATLSVIMSNSLLTSVTWTAYYANTADSFGTLASPTRTQIATGTFTVTSTLSQYTTQIAIPSSVYSGIEIVFSVGAQTSGTWKISNAQLEAGSTATPFERQPYSTQLAQSQRYFEVLQNNLVSNAVTTTQASLIWNFKVTKRVTPTIIQGSGTTGFSGNVDALGTDSYDIRTAQQTTATLTAGTSANSEL